MISGLLHPNRTRWLLFAMAFGFTAIGVLFIHSTMGAPGEAFPGDIARRQILRAGIALIACCVVWRVNYLWVERRAYAIYGVLIAVLCTLLGLKFLQRDDGASRWFRLVFFDVQPSELMKLAVILALARYLRFREDYRRLRGLVFPVLLTVVPMGLVLLQPDLGTSLMFPPILIGMLYISGARPRHLVVAIVLGALLLPTAYFLGEHLPLLRGYQMRRVTAFFEQWDPVVRKHEAYHLDQSEVALGNGGLWGRGLGEGTQNTLGHLPAKHTDFIYSVIGEEWGFVGVAGMTLAFFLFVALALRVAYNTREPFGRLVVVGVAVAFAAQSFQNMSMTMGLSPITGLPLPFVSYGGSSLVATWASLGLVLRVASQRVTVVATRDLDPRDRERCIPVEDDRPAGSVLARWPT